MKDYTVKDHNCMKYEGSISFPFKLYCFVSAANMLVLFGRLVFAFFL